MLSGCSKRTHRPKVCMCEQHGIDGGRGRKRKKHIVLEEDEETDHETGPWCPPNWNEQWNNIFKMRLRFNAPIDWMECETLGDRNMEPAKLRYQILISFMLSSQTRDLITTCVMARLKIHGCDVDTILDTTVERLQALLYPVMFNRVKAEYILETTAILKTRYGGDIPNTVKDLCRLPGVGPKMAHLVMKYAWNKVTGIAVDTHVHKVCNRLGWTRTVTKSPPETQAQIESWIPRSLWSDINFLLAGFGQQICLTTKPKCDSCLNRSTCLFKLGVRDVK